MRMRQSIKNQAPDFNIKPDYKLPYFFEKDGLEMKSDYTKANSKSLTDKKYSKKIKQY